MIDERNKVALAAAKVRGVVLGNPEPGRDQSGEGGRAGSSAAPAHPPIEQRHRSRSQCPRHTETAEQIQVLFCAGEADLNTR